MESQNNFTENGSTPDPYIDGQVIDTIQVPFWDGNPSDPYPSVTLKMDFRRPDTGDFVYHCHIAEHGDGGMMAIIRVEPSGTAAALERTRLYLTSLGESLGFIGVSDALANARSYAWCRTRSAESRRALSLNAHPGDHLLALEKTAPTEYLILRA